MKGEGRQPEYPRRINIKVDGQEYALFLSRDCKTGEFMKGRIVFPVGDPTGEMTMDKQTSKNLMEGKSLNVFFSWLKGDMKVRCFICNREIGPFTHLLGCDKCGYKGLIHPLRMIKVISKSEGEGIDSG